MKKTIIPLLGLFLAMGSLNAQEKSVTYRPYSMELKMGLNSAVEDFMMAPVLGMELRRNLSPRYDLGVELAFLMFPEGCVLKPSPYLSAIGDANFDVAPGFKPFVGAGLGIGYSWSDFADHPVVGQLTVRGGATLWKHLRLTVGVRPNTLYKCVFDGSIGFTFGIGKEREWKK